MADKSEQTPKRSSSKDKKVRDLRKDHKERDDREKEREKERDRDKDKEKEKDREREKEKEKDREKEKDHSRETSLVPSAASAFPPLVDHIQIEIQNLSNQQKRLESLLDQLRVASESSSTAHGVDEVSAKASALKDEIERLHREKEDLKKKVVRSIPRDDAICTRETTKSTLRKYRDTMLYSMFSGRYKILQDRDGRFFLDRDGSMFGHILNFLRTGQMSILNLEDLQQLRLEADFFAIQPLLRLIDQRISEVAKRQYAVLRYNENSNYNNLSWQGITQPVLLTLGGSLYKSIDQVLTEVDQAGWELTNMSGDGSAEGGWMYVFKKKPLIFIEDGDRPLRTSPDGSSSDRGTPRKSTSNTHSTSSTIARAAQDGEREMSRSTGVLLVNDRRLQREHSGSF